MILIRKLASTRLTLLGMAILALGAGLSYDNPVDTPVWVLVVPLAFLSLNLFAAIIVYPAINQRGGLLLFHVGLLAICILAAIGRLTHYEAHIEMLQGSEFDVSLAENIKQGPFHKGELDQVRFVQGPYTVEYAPHLSRGPTRSHVAVPNSAGGWDERVVGDDTPLLLDGYRFYTSFNKGFTTVLTWLPDQGETITGTVNMPSYPLFEYKQDNYWTPPGGEEIKFWLLLDTGYDTENSWVLDGNRATAKLVVNSAGNRVELNQGEEVELPGGRLRYEALTTWMGYKIFYDPTLKWLFFAAMMTVLGLAQHYWKKFAEQPMAEMELDETKKQKRAANKAVTV